LDLEDVFCSKIRMRVLKLLFIYGQMNTSDIAERLKVNYKLALGHLELLEKETVVQHRSSGRIKYFRFASTPKACATIRLLENWANEQLV
jgi:predicted ArsR family transcriptional regulator